MSISLSEQAYQQIRRMIVRLDLAPGAVVREDELQRQLGHRPHADPRGAAAPGARPVRDRHAAAGDVRVAHRRGRAVDAVRDAGDPRAVRRPAGVRRGGPAHWDAMAACLARAERPGVSRRRVARHRSRVPRDHLGRRRATASSPTRSTCCTPRATGCGTCTSPTSPTCCHAVDEHRRDPRRPASTATATAPPSWPRPTSARSTQQIRDAVTRRLGPPLAGT